MPALPKRKPPDPDEKARKEAATEEKKAQALAAKEAKKAERAAAKDAKKAKAAEAKEAKKLQRQQAQERKKEKLEAAKQAKQAKKDAKAGKAINAGAVATAFKGGNAAAAQENEEESEEETEEEEEEEEEEKQENPVPQVPPRSRNQAAVTPTGEADSDDESSDDESSADRACKPAPDAASASSSAPAASVHDHNVVDDESSDEESSSEESSSEEEENGHVEQVAQKSMKPTGPDFQGAGQKPGVMVWRIEKFRPVPVELKFHGKFFTGDSYIVLSTTEEKSGSLTHNLYFWLGEETSHDEQGAAAKLSIDLDNKLGGSAVQFRVVQGHEPPDFVAAMGGLIEYMEGGCASGFRHVVPDKFPIRLLHVKGLTRCRVEQVKKSSKSLNSGDVFILDTGKIVYQWNGKESSTKERSKALEVCLGIKNERVHMIEQLGQEVSIVTVREGQQDADEDAFWATLGGDRSTVAAAKVDSEADDKMSLENTTLWHLKEHSSKGKSKLKFNEIKERPLVRSMLDPDDTYILVCPAEIFVWIGSKASTAERQNAMIYAQDFLKKGADGKKRPKWTPITRVTQGAEPTAFSCKFKEWDLKAAVDAVRLGVLLGKGISSGKNVAGKIRQETPLEIASGMTISKLDMKMRVDASTKSAGKLRKASDGTLTIWRVANFKKVDVPKAMFGVFYAGDCYIIRFSYRDDRNKEAVLLYHWHGRLCSSDEKGSAAMLTIELDKNEEQRGIMATQVRVVQNNEPEDFLALFGGDFVVRDGGLSKDGVDTRDHDGIGLFQVKGHSSDTVRTVQVAESAASLNSSDCFILQTPGVVHVWLGSLASEAECEAGGKVGHAMSKRLKYEAEHFDAEEAAKLAAEAALNAAAVAAAAVDEDGDGVPDVAESLLLMVDADGDGISDGLHADKLGLFVPQADRINERPFYANDSIPELLLWWSGGKWWLGKANELGRNRGWLKVESSDVAPPREGWLVYSKKDKKWDVMEGMVAVPAERIAFKGNTDDEKLNDKLGVFARCVETHEGRPIYVREGRRNLMLWWNSGRWWLGKRSECKTNRGWIKVISEAQSPSVEGLAWTFYSSVNKKWQPAEITCEICDSYKNKVLPDPAKLPPPCSAPQAQIVKEWTVNSCKEGEEPPEFWEAIGGKKPYERAKLPVAAEGFLPRLFSCSDQTGAFKTEEVMDFSQEDLDRDNVYILDTWSSVFVWVGKDSKESEGRSAMEVACAYVSAQAELDGRPADMCPLYVQDGEEPQTFTLHFVGWSKKHLDQFEDPYEKKQKLVERTVQQEKEEAPLLNDGRPIPLAELIKRTASRNGGMPPPVAAVCNGEVVPASPGSPSVPQLELGMLKQLQNSSSLQSARKRANAAMAAESSLSGRNGTKYVDPETHQFSLDELRDGPAAETVNPLCKEVYLHDSEFHNIFGQNKVSFWRQPHWKQRDAKRKVGLF